MAQRKGLLLFSRPDAKFESWARGVRAISDIHEAVSAWRPWFGFCHFLRYRVQGYRVDAFVVRYLNDPGSLASALLRLGGDAVTLFVARLLGIPIFWILHNVDRETCNQRPLIIRCRRHLVRRNASAFFVTEKALVEPAQRLHALPAPVHVLPLGEPSDACLYPEQSSDTWDRFRSGAERWLRAEGAQAVDLSPCLLVVGTPEEKYTHFWRLRELLDHARRRGLSLRALIVAPLDEGYGENLRRELAEHVARGTVYLSETYVPLNWKWAKKHCTALLRGYSDLSMSHAIYHSVSVGMPVLAMPGPVIPKVVRDEEIGEVLEDDFSNLEQVLRQLQPLNDATVAGFFSARSGVRAAEVLLQTARDVAASG